MYTSIQLFVLKLRYRNLTEQIENLIAHDADNPKVDKLLKDLDNTHKKINKILDKLDKQ